MKSCLTKTIIGLFLVIFFLALIGLIYQKISESSDRKKYPPKGVMIGVDDTEIHINSEGQGEPTVLLISGAGDIWAIWEPIQSQLKKSTKVVSYDRPGLGQSAFYSGENLTLEKQAEILYKSLQKTNNSGPYIVVGHSVGGLIARNFAKKYASEVVGVVLVDSSVEGQFSKLPKEILESNKSAGAVFSVASVAARVGLHRLLGMGTAKAKSFELLTEDAQNRIAASLHQTRGFSALQKDGAVAEYVMEQGEPFGYGALGHTPLRIITRGLPEQDVNKDANYSESRIEMFTETQKIWLKLQEDLLNLSSDSKQIITTKSGHYIHTTEPELVIGVVEKMLSDISTKNATQK